MSKNDRLKREDDNNNEETIQIIQDAYARYRAAEAKGDSAGMQSEIENIYDAYYVEFNNTEELRCALATYSNGMEVEKVIEIIKAEIERQSSPQTRQAGGEAR